MHRTQNAERRTQKPGLVGGSRYLSNRGGWFGRTVWSYCVSALVRGRGVSWCLRWTLTGSNRSGGPPEPNLFSRLVFQGRKSGDRRCAQPATPANSNSPAAAAAALLAQTTLLILPRTSSANGRMRQIATLPDATWGYFGGTGQSSLYVITDLIAAWSRQSCRALKRLKVLFSPLQTPGMEREGRTLEVLSIHAFLWIRAGPSRIRLTEV